MPEPRARPRGSRVPGGERVQRTCFLGAAGGSRARGSVSLMAPLPCGTGTGVSLGKGKVCLRLPPPWQSRKKSGDESL